MTTTEPRRSLYQYVRPGMVVTDYSGNPLEVDGVRFVTRALFVGTDMQRIMSCVALSGWYWKGNEYVHTDKAFQRYEGRTRILREDNWLADKQAHADGELPIQALHTYSPRLTRKIRIPITVGE